MGPVARRPRPCSPSRRGRARRPRARRPPAPWPPPAEHQLRDGIGAAVGVAAASVGGQAEHAPRAAARDLLAARLDPQALVEHGRDRDAADAGQRPDRERPGHHEPVVGVDEGELHQHQGADVGGVRRHLAEVRPSVLERPPPGVGHPVKDDLGRDEGLDVADGRDRGRAGAGACSSGVGRRCCAAARASPGCRGRTPPPAGRSRCRRRRRSPRTARRDANRTPAATAARRRRPPGPTPGSRSPCPIRGWTSGWGVDGGRPGRAAEPLTRGQRRSVSRCLKKPPMPWARPSRWISRIQWQRRPAASVWRTGWSLPRAM